jgi:caa(3)-type oxidase subunit IV
LILFVGTVLTVLAAQHNFGSRHLNLGIGLLIATVKASLVALIFMHLKSERGMIYKFLLFTAIFFAGMMFLFVLAVMDPLHFNLLKMRQ